MSFPVPNEYDMPDIKYNNGTVITLPPSLSGDGTGVNLSQLEKGLILTLFSKAAYAEDDAVAAYDTLEGLWTAPQKEVESITAVYTQSGTVYDTDSLDVLKSDLVVTANYSDSTIETVTGYTLSGTLTTGTSTVTVSYGGKTATFNVTVTHYVAPPIYQLTVSDRYTYSSNDNIIGASAGNRLIHTTGSNSRLAYIMLDGVMRGGRQSLVYWLPVQAGDTYTFKLKNITYEGNTDASNKFASAFKDESDVSIIAITSIAIPSTGDGTVADQEITGTISADANLILYSLVYRAVKISYDIELYINDVRYV